MVDGQHVARTEFTAEKVDDECKGCPPCNGTSKEADDDEEQADEIRKASVSGGADGNVEDGEEGENIGNDQDEIGDGQPEDGNEILPQRGLASTISANLWYGILQEDVDAEDDYTDACHDSKKCVILLDLRLQNGVEEQCCHRHQGICRGDTEARNDARTAALRQGALDAQNGNWAHGDRCGNSDTNSAE